MVIIVQQPDGFLAAFNDTSDSFERKNMNQEQAIRFCVHRLNVRKAMAERKVNNPSQRWSDFVRIAEKI